MKKILLSTIVLIAFVMATMLFDISCKKSAVAQNSNSNIIQQNKIIYLKYQTGTSSGTTISIYSANYDGSNAQQIKPVLPSGVAINDNFLSISPDGKTIFFSVYNNGNEIDGYSCNFDGSNVKKVTTYSEHIVAF